MFFACQGYRGGSTKPWSKSSNDYRQGKRISVSRLWSLVGALGARPRLMLLVLLAIGPLLVLLLLGAATDRRQVLADAHREVGELARLGARQEHELVQQLRTLLQVLARDPDIASMSAADCNAMLDTIGHGSPPIQGLFVVRNNGGVACSSTAAEWDQSSSDLPWFHGALASNAPRFELSPILIDRLSGKPTMIAASPLPPASPGSRADGVVAAALDLSWFSEFAARIVGQQAHIAMIMDVQGGTMLVRYPDQANWTRRSVPDPRLLASFAASPAGGVAQVAGLDNEALIVGFAPLPSASAAPAAMLVIGMPRNIVLAAARHRLVIGAILAFAAAAMAFGAAWFVAEFTQIRPLRHLTRNALLFGAGDLAARTRMPAWHAPEFRVLAGTWKQVADDLLRHAGELAAAQADAARSEAELRTLAESCTDVIVRLDPDFRRRYVSPACRDLLGYEPAELLGGHPRETVHPNDWPALQAGLTCLRKGEQSPGLTYRCRDKNGRYIWLELRGRSLAGGEGYVVVLRDITLRKQAEDQLAKANRILEVLALQDSLTGLANRRAFDDALLREFRRTARERAPLALVLIDADHFKGYNDLYGHPAGDAALCAIANAVRRSLQRPGDFAARYGGEELVVLLPSTDQSGAKALAERIRQQVRLLDLEHVGSPHGVVTISAGVAAIHPAIDGGPADLLDAADHALYAAKASGRDQVRSLLVARQLVSDATLEEPHRPV